MKIFLSCFVVLYGLLGYLTNCQSVNTVVRNVRRNTLIAANKSATVRDLLRTSRVKSSRVIARLARVSIPVMPFTVCDVSRRRAVDVLNQSLVEISNLKPYWDLVLREEVRFEDSRFKEQMNNVTQILHRLQRTLCQYINSRTDCNSNMALPQIRNINPSARWKQDYIIARDTVKFMLCISRQLDNVDTESESDN